MTEIARRCDKHLQQGMLDTTATRLKACMKPKLPESRTRGKAISEEIVQQIKERTRLDRAFRYDLLASPWRVLQAYPLTEEEKHLFVAPNFSWMIENRLAGVSYPRSEDAIALLRKLGVQALLNLSEELLPLDLLSTYQLREEHLSVADFTAPTLEQVERALIIHAGDEWFFYATLHSHDSLPSSFALDDTS